MRSMFRDGFPLSGVWGSEWRTKPIHAWPLYLELPSRALLGPRAKFVLNEDLADKV
jgi:hypothetical protein